jgi:hypothetical protein
MSLTFKEVKSFSDGTSLLLCFSESSTASEVITLQVTLDVSWDRAYVGAEMFWIEHFLGREKLSSFQNALGTTNLVYSYDEECDILTLNVNATKQDVNTQIPGMAQFAFSSEGNVISLKLYERISN